MTSRRGPFRFLCLSLALWCLAGAAGAQGGLTFDRDTYYQQCLRFEAGGDLDTARQSCLTTLQIDPGFAPAGLSLARIDLALGNLEEARSRLLEFQDDFRSAEPQLLLAEIALQQKRYEDAAHWLEEAGSTLEQHFNAELRARRHYLLGLLAERQGDYPAALLSYADAARADSLDAHYRLADARLRFKLGRLADAKDSILDYQEFANDYSDAELLSLLGRVEWAMGDMPAAAAALESAVLHRNDRDSNAQAADLRDLALVYYGQGDLRAGGLALRAAVEHGNLLAFSLSHLLPWLLVLVALLALHLLGESRVEASGSPELGEGPELWSVGQVYGVLSLSLLFAGLGAVAYGVAKYDNYLAIITPVQSAEVRALFFAVLSVLLVAFALLRAHAKGWAPWEALLGGSSNFWPGIGLGLVFVALVLGVLAYAPDWPWLKGFYLDLSKLTPLMVAAVVVIPLFELFFRAFAIPALAERYSPALAVLVSATLYTLVFGSPVALLFALGLALSEIYRRRPGGLTPLVAQLTLHLGLVLAIAYSGWARALFL